MKKFLTIKDGHEDSVNLLITIEQGMEKELENTMDHLTENGQTVEISYGTMTDEEYRENGIKSIMYGDGCDREEAIKVLDGVPFSTED